MNTTQIQPINFVPFNEDFPFRCYRGHHLPHVRQKGCTYFVTFRLADSVPKGQMNQWSFERRKWLDARGIDVTDSSWRDKFEDLPDVDKDTFERAFASRLFESLDNCHGECQLRNGKVREIVISALKYFDNSRIRLGDFVVMPNHVHALMTPLDDFELEDVLHSIKSWSANQINVVLGRRGEFWMKDTYDRLSRCGEELLRTQAYIRANPVKAKLKQNEYWLETAEYSIES